MDNLRCCVVLLMLDLSAAFDTIDHQILLDRLQQHYGITGAAHKVLQSYLQKRTQSVVVDGVSSKPKLLNYGVPQGSGLGPKKYCMYGKPIGVIIRIHGMDYHIYADDSQLYLVLAGRQDIYKAMSSLQDCVSDIKRWMARNWLKLNEDKTEIIYFQSKFLRNPFPTPVLQLGDSQIIPATSVKNLGSYLDSEMSMDRQISETSRKCWAQISSIGKIRKYLDTDSCKTLVNATVTSNLDYCNGLLVGCTTTRVKKLQKVQNASARLIKGGDREEHITPTLYELHWLPFECRVDYDILVNVFKCRNGLAPVYLCELLEDYDPTRTLRSSTDGLLKENTPVVPTYGNQSFSVAAPKLWNRLPICVRSCTEIVSYKKALKTHLFKTYFNKKRQLGLL